MRRREVQSEQKLEGMWAFCQAYGMTPDQYKDLTLAEYNAGVKLIKKQNRRRK